MPSLTHNLLVRTRPSPMGVRMKPTSSIPAVREAAKAASGHVQYYQNMMKQAKSSTATPATARQSAQPARGGKK